MKRKTFWTLLAMVGMAAATLAFVSTACTVSVFAQQTTSASAVVPSLVEFSGVLTGTNGKPMTGITGVTFFLYAEQQGGSPLWLETQNVQPDKNGNYIVQLGSTNSQGLPPSWFVSGQARWLGVQPQGQEEQPRVMLLSVPYALKAGDAQTLGGRPASAFVLAAPPTAQGETSSPGVASGSGAVQPGLSGSGTADYIPLWTNSTTLGNSVLYQSGTGSKAKVGVNTTTPASMLDVKGAATVRGLFALPATGTATATSGYDSQPIEQTASAFNSTTGTAVTQNFQWQAEPVDNDTSNASGTLNLLFGQGTNKPAETGLNIASTGQITFANGQTFPGTGTVTSVGSGLGLTGGPITNSGTLAIDTTVVPQLNAANTFTANQTVNGTLTANFLVGNGANITNVNASQLNGLAASAFAQLAANNTFTGNQTVNGTLAATGIATGSAYAIGSNLFAFGSYDNSDAFLGFAGNTTMTGCCNTASGQEAFSSNTSGNFNTANGPWSLYSNTSGYSNEASGADTLYSNSTGCCNTADGAYALEQNTTGSQNTAVGMDALYGNTTGTGLTCIGYQCSADDGLTNATAIGAHAIVAQSDSLVLGGAGKWGVKVGIGTTKPSNILTIGRGLGHPLSDSWETYSSRRWKTNIHTLHGALGKIEQMRGVSYDLKDTGKHEIGVIAEEVGSPRSCPGRRTAKMPRVSTTAG